MFNWLSDLLSGKSRLAKETDSLADTVRDINHKLRQQCGLDTAKTKPASSPPALAGKGSGK